MAGPFVIGVDGGTGGMRAGVFDLQGTPVAFASTEYETRFPQPSWAEQDPEDWWQALGAAVRAAMAEAGVDGSAISAISVDTTCCSVVVLDENGAPLRPALIWMDMRSAPQTEKVVATGDAALAVNSAGAGPVSAEWMIPKALWVKENEPEIFERAATICEFQDYIHLSPDRPHGRQHQQRLGALALPVGRRWLCRGDGTFPRHGGDPGEMAARGPGAGRSGQRPDAARGRTPGPACGPAGCPGRCRRLHRHDWPRRRQARPAGLHHRVLPPASGPQRNAGSTEMASGAPMPIRSFPVCT